MPHNRLLAFAVLILACIFNGKSQSVETEIIGRDTLSTSAVKTGKAGIGASLIRAMPVSTGHVGIGVLMPRATLEVSGELRVGNAGVEWSPDSIGEYSVAYGLNTQASGKHAAAWGNASKATGENATAWGDSTRASGINSTAWGIGTTADAVGATAFGNHTSAKGLYSFAAGDSTVVYGYYSAAFGSSNFILGYGSVAFGFDNAVWYDASAAFGHSNTAFGYGSTVFGQSNVAWGDYSTSMGIYTKAGAYASLAIGRYNKGAGDDSYWIARDPVFEIGIGLSSELRKNAMVIYKNAAALWLGEYDGVSPAPPPASGAGTRMMWYPDKAAFRVGGVSGNNWDNDSIGGYSMALCLDTKASGFASIAMGFGTTASGGRSTATGDGTTASGSNSIAMGFSTTASGNGSTAMGNGTEASGNGSTAMGNGTEALGSNSIAMGNGTEALGSNSTVMGLSTNAESYVSVAMGRYNVGGGNAFFWQGADPLFEIGIGLSNASRANAMTVLKNGNVGINTVAPGAHRLNVSSSGAGTNGSTGYFKNTASNGIALSIVNSSSASSDNTLLVTNYGSTGNLASFDSYQGSNTWNRRFKFTNAGDGRCDGSWIGGGADYAEFFPKVNPSIEYEMGDVISMSPKIGYAVESADVQNPNLMLGVYSTNPVVIGNSSAEEDPDDAVLVGLMGVIPTKICDENGPVRIGDFLTISSIPGVAMKAAKSGMVIGRAMEDFSGNTTGKINVYVEVDWVQIDDNDSEIIALQHETEKLRSETQVLRSEMNAMQSVMQSETFIARSEIEELKAMVKALTEDQSQ